MKGIMQYGSMPDNDLKKKINKKYLQGPIKMMQT